MAWRVAGMVVCALEAVVALGRAGLHPGPAVVRQHGLHDHGHVLAHHVIGFVLDNLVHVAAAPLVRVVHPAGLVDPAVGEDDAHIGPPHLGAGNGIGRALQAIPQAGLAPLHGQGQHVHDPRRVLGQLALVAGQVQALLRGRLLQPAPHEAGGLAGAAMDHGDDVARLVLQQRQLPRPRREGELMVDDGLAHAESGGTQPPPPVSSPCPSPCLCPWPWKSPPFMHRLRPAPRAWPSPAPPGLCAHRSGPAPRSAPCRRRPWAGAWRPSIAAPKCAV